MPKLLSNKKPGEHQKPRANDNATPLAACDTSLGLLEIYLPAGAAPAKYATPKTGAKTSAINYSGPRNSDQTIS